MGYAKGIKWSHNLIKSELINVIDNLGIDYMPSCVDIVRVTNNYKLINAISKSGGVRYWANELNLKLKKSTTRTGNDAEWVIADILKSFGFNVNKMGSNCAYDLDVNGVKVDVKFSRRFDSIQGWSSYSFNLEKKNPTCDIYIMICGGVNERVLIIPSKFLKQTQVCLGLKSKYDIFENRWDYITKYKEFYESIQI